MMKKRRLLIKVCFVGCLALTLSCSSDDTDENKAPVIADQSFDVLENIAPLQTIGTIAATDPENEALTFTLDTPIDLTVDGITGDISTTTTLFLDYETATSHQFKVSVVDAAGAKSSATITLNVQDVEEPVLNTLQQRFVDAYIYTTYNLSPTSNGGLLSTKWKDEVLLLLDGDITESYQETVAAFIAEFNELAKDGTQIVLTDDINVAAVHLIAGDKTAIEPFWPDMYELVKDRNFGGYARYNTDFENNITKGRIWVEDDSKGLFMHELGHILGFGHAADVECDTEALSFMCSKARAPQLNQIDTELIRALYSTDIPVGLDQAAMTERITAYVLANGILE